MTIASPTIRPGAPRVRIFAAALLLGAAGAAAVTVAPMAQAATVTPPACSFTGTASVCQTDGNVQVSALQPAVDYQAQYPFYGYEGLLFTTAADMGEADGTHRRIHDERPGRWAGAFVVCGA